MQTGQGGREENDESQVEAAVAPHQDVVLGPVYQGATPCGAAETVRFPAGVGAQAPGACRPLRAIQGQAPKKFSWIVLLFDKMVHLCYNGMWGLTVMTEFPKKGKPRVGGQVVDGDFFFDPRTGYVLVPPQVFGRDRAHLVLFELGPADVLFRDWRSGLRVRIPRKRLVELLGGKNDQAA